ncbi:MAG: hypothetical protein KKE50_00530 [Nanoarchaeota archaeon]|nr:hypothetical protein [Nanoarchaeota archaeon]
MEEENPENKKENADEFLTRVNEEMNNPHRKKLWYSERYRAKYNEQFSKPKQTPQVKQPVSSNSENIIERVEEELKKDAHNTWEFIIEPKHIRILKILAILIPIMILGYLFYANFLISRDFNYFYDIGSLEDAKKPYLTPLARVSEIENSEYRNMLLSLVYFNVPIPRNSETILIQTRFKDNFPNKSVLSLGAKDKEEWHYIYNPIFYSSLSNLGELYKLGNVYLINENLELLPIENLLEMDNISIATDMQLKPQPNKIENWQGETLINTTLRGGHTFYIYISGNLSLDVKKQDINWYNNSDELNIYLYGLDENLIANTTIPDDGITEVKNKDKAIIQPGTLKAENLPEGVYKLVFTDFDGLIREIKINTKKIITPSLFLADSSVYLLEDKKSEIYTNAIKDSELKLLTYHSSGIQDLTFDNKTFNFYQEDVPLYLNLTKGEYTIKVPKNDIILSYPGYFSFSEASYFEPFKQRIIKPEYSLEWLKNNADYFVSNYQAPIEDNSWLVSETSFNIKQNRLFVKDNQLSLLFNIPHLSQEANQNYTIPIGWINITVHKPGLFEKWNKGS